MRKLIVCSVFVSDCLDSTAHTLSQLHICLMCFEYGVQKAELCLNAAVPEAYASFPFSAMS